MKLSSGVLVLALACPGLLFEGCAPAAGPSASARPEATAENKTAGSAPQAGAGAPGTMPVEPATAPERLTVQHILISFAGRLPGKAITRTQEEARALAYELLERARRGEDFDGLVRQFTDDQAPGVYSMCNRGLRPVAQGEYPRDGMVPAFGDVAFRLSPGNIDIADYDPTKSPFGYHIIKRLK
jgi:PPIC-type PPIASE domain